MTRQEYKDEFRRLRRSRKLRNNAQLPKSVFEFGWEIAKFKPQVWIVERILFWMYAYDRTHKWTDRDFLYEINDEAYAKAKAKRKERSEAYKARLLEKHNKPRPRPTCEDVSWEGCSGPPKELLELRAKLDNK